MEHIKTKEGVKDSRHARKLRRMISWMRERLRRVSLLDAQCAVRCAWEGELLSVVYDTSHCGYMYHCGVSCLSILFWWRTVHTTDL